MAVAGRGKDEIAKAFERRLENDLEAEFTEACRQVERIALNRVRGIFTEGQGNG